jgi:protein phosphatase inhibitor 2
VAGSPGEEVETEEEMDEEAAAKHAAFVRARGRHYSNEAEAMKRAAKMVDDEDEEASEASALADGTEDVALNGVHGN